MANATVLSRNMTSTKQFSIDVRVYFEDTDAGGIVYHANYLNYMERARTDWVRALGVSQHQLLEQNIAFVVKDMQITFHQSATLDEMLTVSCQPIKIGNVSILIRQEIKVNNKTIVDATVKIACVDPTAKRPCKIPLQILREMRSDS